MSTLTQTLIAEIRGAPQEMQQEVLDFLEFLKARRLPAADREKLLPLALADAGCRLGIPGGGRSMAHFVSGQVVVVVPFPFSKGSRFTCSTGVSQKGH